MPDISSHIQEVVAYPVVEYTDHIMVCQTGCKRGKISVISWEWREDTVLIDVNTRKFASQFMRNFNQIYPSL